MNTFGKYTNVTEIGRGGSSTVFKAKDTLDRDVAIKILHPALTQDADAVQRFLREARIAARLHHPNIVVIHDIGEEQGALYIVMQYLEGESLATKVARGPLPPGEAVAIAEQVAGALDYAHEQGLVHRDVKPSNIIVSPAGHATLTDFGLVSVKGAPSLTSSGIVGTPDYMAPEQVEPRREWPQGKCMDVYSLGVVMFQMLTGRLPFIADSPLAVMRAHVEQTPPSVSSLRPGIPPPVESAVARALAKNPADRYPSASAFVHDLSVAVQSEYKAGEQQKQLALWYDEAQAMMAARRWVDAVRRCSQILDVNPTYRDTAALMGQATAMAADQIKRWQDLQAIYEQAIALHSEHRFDEAIAGLQEIIKRDADFPQAATRLIEVQAARDEWEAKRQARLAGLYRSASGSLADALHAALDLWSEDPTYADADGVLAALALHPAAGSQASSLLDARRRLKAVAKPPSRAEEPVQQEAAAESSPVAQRPRQADDGNTATATAGGAPRPKRAVARPAATPAADERATRPPDEEQPAEPEQAAGASAASRFPLGVPVPQTVSILGGQFTMGGDQYFIETPKHAESVRSFDMSRYPVTNREYAAYVDDGGPSPRHWKGNRYQRGKDAHPVVNVSWRDALAYCDWLSRQTGLACRLPTEIEWEYAARGSDALEYPWGNWFDKAYCNCQENSRADTTAVGAYSPHGDSPFGCADMAGNVWEWTSTKWRPNYNRKADDDLAGNELRVIRGGSFVDQAPDLRCARRVYEEPDSYDRNVGFRIVIG